MHTRNLSALPGLRKLLGGGEIAGLTERAPPLLPTWTAFWQLGLGGHHLPLNPEGPKEHRMEPHPLQLHNWGGGSI